MNAPGEAPRVVLFLCGHNIVRSPIAASIAGQMFGQNLRVGSAGVRKEDPDMFVAAVMDEIGIDLSRHRPKTLEELVEYEDFDFDLVISLSPEAHHAALEFTRTHPVEVEYWPTEDPTSVEGNREQRLGAYRAVRDQLSKRIAERFSGVEKAGE
jgi:protein-tyrosine-phosphatase